MMEWFVSFPNEEAAQRRRQLASQLRERQDEVTRLRALIGFDGFVDHIVRVVDTRPSVDTYTPVETLSEFADRIQAAAGLSTNVELVVERTKLGGNGPIMALALARLGVQVTCIGPLGTPLHPVFSPLEEAGVELISLGPPAVTDALEFRDGKLMMGKLEPLQHITWDAVVKAAGRGRLEELAGAAHLTAQLNWTMLPHLNAIWEAWQEEMAAYSQGLFFVDFADPEKRPLDQLEAAIESLGRIGRRQPLYLGVNLREALALYHAVTGAPPPASWTEKPSSPEEGGESRATDGKEGSGSVLPEVPAAAAIVHELGPKLAEKGITGLLVHPVRDAAAWREPEDWGDDSRPDTAWIAGAYTPNPVLTTGAGDNFNAGAALGLCLGLSLPDVLWLGKATSGYYVRHGESPTLSQAADFLDAWAAGTLDFPTPSFMVD